MSDDQKGWIFTQHVVQELARTAVHEKIAFAPVYTEAAAVVFREVLSRIDFDAQTVDCTELDIGPLGQPQLGEQLTAVISLVALGIRFGTFLAHEGITIGGAEHFGRSDH